jgi:hypothetical protein
MRLQRIVVSFFASLGAICSVALAQGNSAPPALPGSPGAVFVPLAPCRIVNTLTDVAATGPAQAARHIDIRTTRCGRIVPAYAIGYALTTVSYSHTPPEKLPPGRGRTEHDTVSPAQSNHLIDFTMPSDAEVAIDIYGYYVPAGTPISPTSRALGDSRQVIAASTSPTAAAQGVGRPVTQEVITGDKGQIYLNASVPPFSETGILLTTPNAAFPWIVAKTPTDNAASGFYLFNGANNPYLFARADGALQLLNGAFLDGRSDYFGVSPLGGVSRDNHSVGIPTNIVHDVTLVNPRDLNGGNGQRVVFFNAKTDDENGSPDVTKFQAVTVGFASTQKHINFDSQIYSHAAGNQFYHFRAFSTAETKDTFWVKPATNGNGIINTRADMYVSGHIGLGSTSIAPWSFGSAIEGPTSAVQFGNATDLHLVSNAYQDNSGAWKYKNAGPAANFYLYNGGFAWRTAGNGTPPNGFTWTQPMTLTSSMLSVTPTIQAISGVTYPDGVTQMTAYPFTNTNNTYDLSRAFNGPLASSVTNTSSNSSASASLAAVATNGIAYLRLASNEATPVKDWRIGMTDATGEFKISDNSVTPSNVVMKISGPSTARSIHFAGTVDADKILANYQDMAEWVPAAEMMSAGTVVIVGQQGNNTVTTSTHAYDTSVAGVVSPNPGVLLGVAGPSKAIIATTGRVRVRVDATKSPIHKGDLLVTSDRPGMAMKSEPLDVAGVKLHRPGTLIGKALEPLASGTGDILVLLSLQ